MVAFVTRFSSILILLLLSADVYSFVQVNSVTDNNPPFDDCSISYVDVAGTLGAANYPFNGASVSVVGFAITIDIDYADPGIVLPAITPFLHVVNLGILPAGSYTVTTNGVLGGSISSSLVTSLTVTTCCDANASFSSNATNVCVGDSVILTNSSTGTTSQMWYANNTFLGTTFNYATVASMQGNTVYKLVVTDGICSDSTVFSVNTYNPPVINSIVPSSSLLCVGEQITFVGNATGAFSYTWYKDNILAGSGNTFTSTASGSGIHTYTLVVLSACADTMETTVEFLALPIFDSFNVNDDTLCLGESVSFTTTTTGSTVETWYENNVMIGSGNDLTITPLTAGTYNYNLTITDGTCTDSTFQAVQIFDLPLVNLGPDTNSCSGSVLLDAGSGMISYEWQDLTTNQTILADSGTYYVTVTDLNGCMATDSIEVLTCAGINEFNENLITVSPNPTNAMVTIDLGKVQSDVQIRIVDITGGIVLTEEAFNISSVKFDFKDFESGTYFLQINGNGISSVVKVIRN